MIPAQVVVDPPHPGTTQSQSSHAGYRDGAVAGGLGNVAWYSSK